MNFNFKLLAYMIFYKLKLRIALLKISIDHFDHLGSVEQTG